MARKNLQKLVSARNETLVDRSQGHSSTISYYLCIPPAVQRGGRICSYRKYEPHYIKSLRVAAVVWGSMTEIESAAAAVS